MKLLLLVGGFANNYYLRQRIEDTFGSKFEVKVAPNWYVLAHQRSSLLGRIRLLTLHSQSAVVREALMRGLAEVSGVTTNLPRVRVESRKARQHYGTECFIPYKPRKRPNDDGHSPERK